MWLREIKESTSNDLIVMLVGNKVDKPHRAVSREAGEQLATDLQISFLETSAKTGQSVELAFMALAQVLLDKELGQDHLSYSCPSMIRISPRHSHSETTDSCC